MKLLNKTALYNFFLSLFIIVAGAICFYFILIKISNDDSKEKIYTQKQKILKHLAQIDSIPDHFEMVNEDITFSKINAANSGKETVTDTFIYEPMDNERVPYRILRCTAHTKLYTYQVSISQSLIESEDLIQAILLALFSLLTVYLIITVLIHRFISQRLWQPFYDLLAQLRSFDILESNILILPPTDIEEFRSLNMAIEQMTLKLKTDYQNLKEFTENASHEIQTPLAIIRSKIELMLQSEGLSESQWTYLNAINDAATRLSRLNQSLLLLSKIENGQFSQVYPIDISGSLRSHIKNLEELIATKHISLNEQIEPNIKLNLHPFLLDILFSNLLINAIRHNMPNGFIDIKLDDKTLCIKNSGEALQIEPSKLFSRFLKSSTDKESIGIGLSLIQKIAESQKWKINYSYLDGEHTICIEF